MIFTRLVCFTDKERDVATETERIRQTLQQANNRNTELSNEIKALQVFLDEICKYFVRDMRIVKL